MATARKDRGDDILETQQVKKGLTSQAVSIRLDWGHWGLSSRTSLPFFVCLFAFFTLSAGSTSAISGSVILLFYV